MSAPAKPMAATEVVLDPKRNFKDWYSPTLKVGHRIFHWRLGRCCPSLTDNSDDRHLFLVNDHAQPVDIVVTTGMYGRGIVSFSAERPTSAEMVAARLGIAFSLGFPIYRLHAPRDVGMVMPRRHWDEEIWDQVRDARTRKVLAPETSSLLAHYYVRVARPAKLLAFLLERPNATGRDGWGGDFIGHLEDPSARRELMQRANELWPPDEEPTGDKWKKALGLSTVMEQRATTGVASQRVTNRYSKARTWPI